MSKKGKKLEPYNPSSRRKDYFDDEGFDKVRKFKKDKDFEFDRKRKKEEIRNLRKTKNINLD